MAGVFIGKCIQDSQQCDEINDKRQRQGKGVYPVGGQRHPDQHQGLGNQMADGGSGQVPGHGGGHHDCEYDAHNGIFRAENELEDINVCNNKNKTECAEAEFVPYRRGNLKPDVHECMHLLCSG